MNKIKLTSYGRWYGSASFLIGRNEYYYIGIDGPVLNRIIALERRSPGKALALAKKYSQECEKLNKEDGS